MKYVVILGDGMADRPFAGLGNRTPLEIAEKPTIDALAQNGICGMVKTIPDQLPPGSDTANLSVMGYDPLVYYSGRSPFEAFSLDVPMASDDVIFRCNLVTLEGEGDFDALTITDHSSDEISTEDATELLLYAAGKLEKPGLELYPGTSYRHILVWHGGPYEWQMTPPHDILGRKVTDYLPKGPGSAVIREMMVESYQLLKHHPLNLKRVAAGLRPANAFWIWGEGRKPQLTPFVEKFGLKGAVISAVDLIKGLGKCAGMDVLDVPGATGNLHTNFEAKASAAIDFLRSGGDFVYLHVEAPDECGHRFEAENKVLSIEYLDKRIVQPVLSGLKALDEPFRMLILPDHPTPLALRTHTHDPVPFILYDSTTIGLAPIVQYDENHAAETEVYVAPGFTLMDRFVHDRLASTSEWRRENDHNL